MQSERMATRLAGVFGVLENAHRRLLPRYRECDVLVLDARAFDVFLERFELMLLPAVEVVVLVEQDDRAGLQSRAQAVEDRDCRRVEIAVDVQE